jgi:hypothetical protein
MAGITVEQLADETYLVTVTEEGSSTTHRVTASPSDLAELGDGTVPEQVIEASFRFLLDREPKESILSSFDLSVISRYFPEYGQLLPRYLEEK